MRRLVLRRRITQNRCAENCVKTQATSDIRLVPSRSGFQTRCNYNRLSAFWIEKRAVFPPPIHFNRLFQRAHFPHVGVIGFLTGLPILVWVADLLLWVIAFVDGDVVGEPDVTDEGILDTLEDEDDALHVIVFAEAVPARPVESLDMVLDEDDVEEGLLDGRLDLHGVALASVIVVEALVLGLEELEHADGLLAEIVPHEVERLDPVVEFVDLPFAEDGYAFIGDVGIVEAVVADLVDLLADEAFEQRFLLGNKSFVDFALHKSISPLNEMYFVRAQAAAVGTLLYVYLDGWPARF